MALADADHRYGRGYRPGYLTIGVISTGQCMLFGHGPGPSTLLSGPAEAFHAGGRPGREPGQLVAPAAGPAAACRRAGVAVTALRPVAVNLLGVVEHPALDDSPYRVDRDGAPYVPAGDGGIVLDLRLGDSGVRARRRPRRAGRLPGAPGRRRPGTRWPLRLHRQHRPGCGPAGPPGARGVVLGQRGEEGRVIVGFGQADLARMRPGDEVAVRACGQGLRRRRLPPDVMVMNLDPDLLGLLPVGRCRARTARR